ncbi:type IX secretion system membrane protein PorP/SprF [uncultured Pontibacter sp.]|uniref:PorP/SprF family type IX secretion system membrane protein n=1 Tax=uncultured Pontibacter sp. TaxID=453356 RepID=UPI00262DDF02|nr:type IX secretion system membrane protein PorP/SprF [uncultured Pontibacter sp.]
MKFFTTIIIFCCVCLTAMGQQRPQFTQYVQNNYLLNPAVGGIESYTDLRLGFRSQWVGLEGAPITFYSSIHTSLNKNDRNAPSSKSKMHDAGKFRTKANKNNRFYAQPHHGVGAVAQFDRSGLLTVSSINASYAFHLPVARDMYFSSGFSAGLVQYRLNRNELDMSTPDDPYLSGDIGNMNKLDLGVGLWFYGRDFYVGASGLQLVKSRGDIEVKNSPRASLQPHFYATAGYRIKVNRELDVIPSVLAKMGEGGLTTVDVNAKGIYAERLWAGVSYRHKDAASIMAGVHLGYYADVSYSYDFATSDLNRVSANSHEIVIGFKLNNRNKIICPQWIW